jgi:predicted nucleic acid-binding Zn ribbon protein
VRFRRTPRPLAPAVQALAHDLEPASGLACVQRAWEAAVGPQIAAQAQPVAERGGDVTVRCRSAVWAQEIELLGPGLVQALNSALGADRVRSLRCTAGAGRAGDLRDG